MTLVIKNGHVIDPASGLSEVCDVQLDGAKIKAIAPDLAGDETIDATGCVVSPGLVDIHVHFREPGFESKETIETGSRAAARGGFTSVVTMPNTEPPIDNAGMIQFIKRRARAMSCIRIHPAASATKGRAGKEMTEMAELKDVGAVAVTDDGSDIPSSWVMRRVLDYAQMCGLVYLAHCEDETLVSDGVMNEGYNATRLGLPGLPRAMEEMRIDRNIRIAELAHARIHIQHVTSAEGINIIRRAKEKGLPVTAETCPHYWMLTDDAVSAFGTNFKMNPPLRGSEDVAAVKDALADGTLDCIATDHAPHTFTEKDVEFQIAPFGVVGLETALAMTLTGLVAPGVITLERAVELLTSAPAGLLGLPVGKLEAGGPADVAIFDPEAVWTVDPTAFHSRSANTPFAGMRVRGKVMHTLCNGERVYSAE